MPRPLRHHVGQRRVDLREVADHPLADGRRRHLAELEAQRLDEVLLLRLRLALEEHPRLAVVVEEALAARADLRALDRLREA